MCFALGFFEGLLGLLNPADEFTISLGKFSDDCLFFVNNTVLWFHTLQTMYPPLPFLSHLSSFLLFLKKKAAGTSHKNVFRMKTSGCRDGTLKTQPNKMGTIPQHIHTIPTHCAILRTMHNYKLSTPSGVLRPGSIILRDTESLQCHWFTEVTSRWDAK